MLTEVGEIGYSTDNWNERIYTDIEQMLTIYHR